VDLYDELDKVKLRNFGSTFTQLTLSIYCTVSTSVSEWIWLRCL